MEICWLVINSWEQTTFWFRISDAFWWLYSQNGSKPVTVHHQQTLSLWLTTKHFVLELLSTFNVWLVIYQTLMNVIKKNWAHVFDSFSPINVWKKCIFVCNFYLIKIPLLPSYTHVYVHDVMATITNKHNWSKKGHVFFSPKIMIKVANRFLKQYSSKKIYLYQEIEFVHNYVYYHYHNQKVPPETSLVANLSTIQQIRFKIW